MSNQIIRPVTNEKLHDGEPAAGFDRYGQLWARYYDPRDSSTIISRIVQDVRGKTCPICQRQWEATAESLKNQTFCSEMDKAVHDTCMNGIGHYFNRQMWNRICRSAGKVLKIEETANQYGSYWTGPWYLVTYEDLPGLELVLGSRKRVFHMEAKNISIEEIKKLEAEFVSEDVTKDRNGNTSWIIHAHTQGKAEEYLKKMLMIFVESAAEHAKA